MNLTTERKSTAVKFLAGSAVVLVASLVGLLFNVVILQRCFAFYQWGEIDGWHSGYGFLNGLSLFLGHIFGIFGWRDSSTWYGGDDIQ